MVLQLSSGVVPAFPITFGNDEFAIVNAGRNQLENGGVNVTCYNLVHFHSQGSWGAASPVAARCSAGSGATPQVVKSALLRPNLMAVSGRRYHAVVIS